LFSVADFLSKAKHACVVLKYIGWKNLLEGCGEVELEPGIEVADLSSQVSSNGF
jgi:hypothetical protein